MIRAGPLTRTEKQLSRPKLLMICGKIASGKSTLAARLAQAPDTVLVSEDFWLARLYPGEIATIEDYARCTRRLREAMAPLAADLLRSVSVVLDFQANTPASRAWMRAIFEKAGAAHELHYLRASDAVCKARLGARNARGEHEYRVSEAEFDLFTSHFVEPSAEEGFSIVLHDQG